MIPVILAGGSGARLWPLSRTAYPKQFLALNSEQTLLQETVSRLDGLTIEKPIVICNEEHRFLVAEQLRQKDITADILLEPIGRNTAPAITLAALKAIHESPHEQPILLILSADHVIKDKDAFQAAITSLVPKVQLGNFGTLGIVPTEPATGYGYISISSEQTNGIHQAQDFVEKPDAITAQEYIDSGSYLWNSGIFLLRADQYLEQLQKYQPEILITCKKAMDHMSIDHDFIRIGAEDFEECPNNSIDYALMEPLCSQNNKQVVVVAPLDAGWSDVGSWSSLWEISNKDDNGNAVIIGDKLTKQDVIVQDSHNCLVTAHSKLVTLIGTKDLVVVDTDDALLVADKSQVQNIKDIVKKIKENGRSEHYNHRVVYRPWGKYDSVDVGYRYQVKRITVKPGAQLSLQMHHHRAEHWVVVSGTAKVTNGDENFLITENQSTYIPIGQIHSLENPGSIPLEIIEVQSGAYLGEDDIVRLKDIYGRK